jgi:hypothetical protein
MNSEAPIDNFDALSLSETWNVAPMSPAAWVCLLAISLAVVFVFWEESNRRKPKQKLTHEYDRKTGKVKPRP